MQRRLYRSLTATLIVTATLVCGTALARKPSESRQLEVVYLGNEGFLLDTGSEAVLVDALFGDGLFGYDVVETDVREQLEAAAPPFDSVVLALASHVHGDHFSARAVARFLRASHETHFLSSTQAVQKLLAYDAALADRAHGVFPAGGQQVRRTAGQIGLTVFNLHHGTRDIQNLGLLIEICGVTILHIGDTETSPAEMRTAGLEDLRPDLALLPGWYLRPGRWLEAVDEVIKPHRTVAMHLPSAEAPPSYFWDGLNSRTALVRALQDLRTDAFLPQATGDSIVLDCLPGN